MSDTNPALIFLREAARRDPDRPEPAFRLCATLLRDGDPEASALLNGLLARFPGHAAGWEAIGIVLLDAGKPEAALLCLSRAAQAAPSFALAMRRGSILKDLGQLEKAASAFAQAVALEPRAVRAWFLLGLCAQDRRDFATAAKAYRAALDIEPKLAEAAVNLGTVLQERGDLDAAKAAYAQAVKARPDTFGRVAQAMSTSPRGELWLDLGALRRHLAG